MRRIFRFRLSRALGYGRFLLPVVLLAVLVFSQAPRTTEAVATCEDGPQPSGAVYRICMPAQWNGDLMIWAHGYVDPREPIGIPEGQLTLPDGTSLIDIATGLNFAFATTSYRYNGLAAPWAVADVIELRDIFVDEHGEPDQTYLVGASEGGFVTALALENYPQLFDGGVAACGPVGDFRSQINYFGDFRVIFDYFFPGVIPGVNVFIPQFVIDNWDSVYVPAVQAAITADPHAVEQLLNVTGAPIDPADPSTVEDTIIGLLWYNVHATNDGIIKLLGNPFDNITRYYSGSDDDAALNAGVKRFAATPQALQVLSVYFKTSGHLTSPLVTLHTSGDPIVPAWHESMYGLKVLADGSTGKYYNIPVDRYGHCAFEASEAAFALLVVRILVLVNASD